MNKNLRIGLLIGGCIAYFVWPVDLLPDVLPPLTYADDAAIVLWTIKKVKELLGCNVVTIDSPPARGNGANSAGKGFSMRANRL
ncbi:MAG TPA: YkvA family protein [Pirellulales bacterium]|nr:YkvA family protein [Pirellulales bacterium]